MKNNRNKIKETPFIKQKEKTIEFEIIKIENFYKKYKSILNSPDRLDFYLILFVTSGKGFHWVDFEKYTLKPETILFIRRKQIQKFELNESLKGFMVLFTESFIYKYNEDKDFLLSFSIFDSHQTSSVILPGNTQYKDLLSNINILWEQYNQELDFIKDEILRCSLKLFLLTSERIKRNREEEKIINNDILLYNRMKKFIEENVSYDLTVSKISDQIHISNKKLNALSKKFSGMGTKKLVTDNLLLEAKRQLVHSTNSVKQIGYELKFDEPTNFIKYFKKQTGKTPQSYREDFLIK